MILLTMIGERTATTVRRQAGTRFLQRNPCKGQKKNEDGAGPEKTKIPIAMSNGGERESRKGKMGLRADIRPFDPYENLLSF